MPFRSAFTRIGLAGFMLASLTLFSGCVPWAKGLRSVDDTVTDWRDFVWGKRAFFKRYGRDMSGPFQDGFLEGYHDMLQGGDGCVPVVPPRRYWGWKYQSAGGQSVISDWFDGYRAGVSAAKEDGLADISKVPISSNYNGLSTVPVESIPEGAPLTPIPGPAQPEIILPAEPNIQPTPASPPLDTQTSVQRRNRSSAMAQRTPVISGPVPRKSGRASVARATSGARVNSQSANNRSSIAFSNPRSRLTPALAIQPVSVDRSKESVGTGQYQAVSRDRAVVAASAEQPLAFQQKKTGVAIVPMESSTNANAADTPLSAVPLPNPTWGTNLPQLPGHVPANATNFPHAMYPTGPTPPPAN